MFRRPVLAIVLALAISAEPARACSCLEPRTLAQEVLASTAVFTCRVLDISPIDDEYPAGFQVAVTVEVFDVWKGDPARSLIVTATSSAACGYNFFVGGEYLVFATGGIGPGRLGVFSCSRTAARNGNPDVAALGPPLSTPVVATTWGAVRAMYR